MERERSFGGQDKHLEAQIILRFGPVYLVRPKGLLNHKSRTFLKFHSSRLFLIIYLNLQVTAASTSQLQLSSG